MDIQFKHSHPLEFPFQKAGGEAQLFSCCLTLTKIDRLYACNFVTNRGPNSPLDAISLKIGFIIQKVLNSVLFLCVHFVGRGS